MPRRSYKLGSTLQLGVSVQVLLNVFETLKYWYNDIWTHLDIYTTWYDIENWRYLDKEILNPWDIDTYLL